MEFMTAKEAAEKWGITPRRVQVLCAEGRIPGAWRLGNAWAIPINSEKPRDGRTLQNSIDKGGEIV
ncbi:MAG: helix-turn-helix domain-containing protein [Herbinix sp.]|nr:helix-turn-helix domain-containing protein [Herbinix sp.]